MSVLVDTSIWIGYFRNGNHYKELDLLIDENIVVPKRLNSCGTHTISQS